MTSLKYLIILFFSISIIYSQDTNIIKYFPLNVGNVWVYNGYAVAQNCSRSFLERVYIDSCKMFNGKYYFKINSVFKLLSGTGNCGFSYLSNGYYRIDSLSGNIYKQRIDTLCQYSQYEILVDSLHSKKNDTVFNVQIANYFRKF
jgi:hypothetical protein